MAINLQKDLIIQTLFTTWVLAWSDIRSKYRRTKLGPVWLVLGMAITLTLMSIIWGQIFDRHWQSYLSYIILGMVTWIWISNYVVQATEIYSVEFAGILKAMPVSPVLLACRFIFRGFIMYLHYIPIFTVVLFLTGTIPTINSLIYVPLGVILILTNGVFFTVLMGIVGARFRDVAPLISAVMAPMMLMTPVLWHPSDLGSWSYIANINPFTHFINILRAPLTGNEVPMFTILFILIFTFCNGIISSVVWFKNRNKLIFWL